MLNSSGERAMELGYNLMWWLSLMMDYKQIFPGKSELSALW